MLGSTLRQRVAVFAVGALGAAAIVGAIAAQWQLFAASVAALVTGGVVIVLDVRRRQAEMARRLKSATARLSVLSGRYESELAAGETNAAILADIARSHDDLRAGLDDLQAAGERRDEMLTHHLGARGSGLRSRMSWLVREQTREVEALLQLFNLVNPKAPMPPSGQWALNPTGLLNLYTLVERQRPDVVVELGSGTSTIWVGYALAAVGGGRLISIDHDESYAALTRAAVELHADRIGPTEVRVAPLRNVMLSDEQFLWYDVDVLADIDRIDMLIVDGPPGGTGPQARYPAVPALLDRLADGAVVLIDDTNRGEERKIADRWAEIPGFIELPTLVGEQAVLRYTRPDDGPGAG